MDALKGECSIAGIFAMNVKKWLKNNTSSLVGKTVAVTGTTGGLGNELCRYLAELGASLILLDRNYTRSSEFRDELVAEYGVKVDCITVDLEDMESVICLTQELAAIPIDIFIHNAGAYSIPRKICSTGYDNVFQINFVSPYYIIRTLLPVLRARGGRAVAVGSIAHDYSKADEDDVDFSTRARASRVYGNAKRYLMYALWELFKDESSASLAIVHPGISFTNITAHYPKLIFAVIKHPMKVIFMKPKKACLSILKGCFEPTGYCRWIGPWMFDVWGRPAVKKVTTADENERSLISQRAEEIFHRVSP